MTLLFAWSGTLACAPAPDAKPSSRISELRLPQKPLEPAVFLIVKKYAIYMKPHDVLALLQRKSHYSIRDENDLLKSLQSRVPLQADVSTNALVAALAPRMMTAKEDLGSDAAREERRFWGAVEARLSFVIAEMLESGKAAVVDLATGQSLSTLTLEEHNDVCSGGRRFSAPSGEVIVRTSDWVS